jgi:hypothetical protein
MIYEFTPGEPVRVVSKEKPLRMVEGIYICSQGAQNLEFGHYVRVGDKTDWWPNSEVEVIHTWGKRNFSSEKSNMKFHAYEVGKPYNPKVRTWPPGSQYNFRSGSHELLLFFEKPTEREIESIRKGAAEFALVVEPPLIVLLFRFGQAIPWSDAPYTFHVLPEAEKQLPTGWEEGSPNTRALIDIYLISCETGIIRAMRQVTVSPEFTRSLHKSIWEQANAPYDAKTYNLTLANMFKLNTEQLLARTKYHSKGGA